MAQQKFNNFKEFSDLWPECSFVFIGDNGQGDVRVGELMLKRDKNDRAGQVEAVFIHEVQPIEQTPGYSPEAAKEWKRLGIYFFSTYIGLAVEAAERGLIAEDGVIRVAHAARDEFEQTEFASEKERNARLLELNRDLTRANDFIHVCQTRTGEEDATGQGAARAAALVETARAHSRPGTTRSLSSRRGSVDIYIPFLRKQSMIRFAVGDAVVTCMGEGQPGRIVSGPRDRDGMYEVHLVDPGGDLGIGVAAAAATGVYSTWQGGGAAAVASARRRSSRVSPASDGFIGSGGLSSSSSGSSSSSSSDSVSSSGSNSSGSNSSSSSSGTKHRGNRSDRRRTRIPRSTRGQLSHMDSFDIRRRASFSVREGITVVFATAANLRRVKPLPPGTPVLTPFGTGVLDEVRPLDGIHVVTMVKIIDPLDRGAKSLAAALAAATAAAAKTPNDTLPKVKRPRTGRWSPVGDKNVSKEVATETASTAIVDEFGNKKCGATAESTTTAHEEAGRRSHLAALAAEEEGAAVEEEEDSEARQKRAEALVASANAAALTPDAGSALQAAKAQTKGYLNASDILLQLEAAVGDRVKTALGDGVIVSYRPVDNVYVVRLCASGQARLDRPSWAIMYLSAGSEYNISRLQRLSPEEDSRNRCVVQ